jgi:hypothetical protein
MSRKSITVLMQQKPIYLTTALRKTYDEPKCHETGIKLGDCEPEENVPVVRKGYLERMFISLSFPVHSPYSVSRNRFCINIKLLYSLTPF